MLFKRSQKAVSDGSKHWYQDKYQHVLVQRNMLALVALVALLIALAAVFAVMRLAPLKSVEPYLIEVDPRTGITQKVDPITRYEYAANEAVDRYFVSTYIRTREGYNFSTTRYNFNLVRVMSAPDVFFAYRRAIDPAAEGSLANTLGTMGLRSVKFRSLNYVTNPPLKSGRKDAPLPTKIMQARIITSDSKSGGADADQYWVVTVTFQYANLNLNVDEKLLNPLGFNVVSYQIQKELN